MLSSSLLLITTFCRYYCLNNSGRVYLWFPIYCYQHVFYLILEFSLKKSEKPFTGWQTLKNISESLVLMEFLLWPFEASTIQVRLLTNAFRNALRMHICVACRWYLTNGLFVNHTEGKVELFRPHGINMVAPSRYWLGSVKKTVNRLFFSWLNNLKRF